MHFYLSSYQLCDHPLKFSAKFKTNRKVAVILNALDFKDDKDWLQAREAREISSLKSIGLEGHTVDLRDFFNSQEQLKKELSSYGGFWVSGGNVFVLRKAMQRSGFDECLRSSLATDLVYGGYSAGICVLGPSLHGLHLVDPPDVNPIWDGLGILKYGVAPHYASPHHESHLIEHTIRYYIDNKMLFVALKDGESISCEMTSA